MKEKLIGMKYFFFLGRYWSIQIRLITVKEDIGGKIIATENRGLNSNPPMLFVGWQCRLGKMKTKKNRMAQWVTAQSEASILRSYRSKLVQKCG